MATFDKNDNSANSGNGFPINLILFAPKAARQGLK